MQSPLLYPLLLAAAKRYVAGETRADVMTIAQRMENLGYRLSVEHIGENTLDIQTVQEAKQQFLGLIEDTSHLQSAVGISFDLSHLGLLIDSELAFAHVEDMAERALQQGQYLMISMEESEKTEAIVGMYERLAQRHKNVGITIQAHLHRSVEDIKRVVGLPGKIRLVKGAFKERPEIALARSAELNERYLELADICIQSGCELSLATHDQAIMDELIHRHDLRQPHVEVELLYGVRPELAHALREKGISVRLYLTYGTEWYLYLCHRLAEHPPHVHQAIADMFDPSQTLDVGYGI